MGRVALAVTLPAEERDVSSFAVTIHANGSTRSGPSLEVLELPLTLDGTVGGPLPAGAESSRPFADGIVVMAAGTYLACAQPQLATGGASQQCALAERSFTVAAGATVDVLLVSQCQGTPTGAAAVSAALNSPPAILSLDVDPARFVAPCESATLEADVQDPDGDPVTVAWSVVEAPETALAELAAAGAVATFQGTQSTGPYVMIDGTLIANSWADLTDGTIAHAIDRTELNTLYTGAVWTSTAPDGTFVGSVSCNGWTALGSNVTGLNGSATATTGPWTQAGGTFCNNAFPLYCFQQYTRRAPARPPSHRPAPPMPRRTEPAARSPSIELP